MANTTRCELKAIRQTRGVTQKKLAKQVGLTQQALSRFEAGVAPKGLMSALAIAKALRVRVTAIWPDAAATTRRRSPTTAPTHRLPAGAGARRSRPGRANKSGRSANSGGK